MRRRVEIKRGFGSQQRRTVHTRLLESDLCELASQRFLELDCFDYA